MFYIGIIIIIIIIIIILICLEEAYKIKLNLKGVRDAGSTNLCPPLSWYNRNGWLGVKHQVTYLRVRHVG